MAWDPESYKKNVLAAARRSGEPPGDLQVMYGFGDRLPSGQDAFDKQVATVVALWNAHRNKPGWTSFIDKLLNKHAQLDQSGALTPQAFEERRAKERRDAERELGEKIKQFRATATHVGPDMLAALRKDVGGLIDEKQLRRALAAANIAVVDQMPDLPATEPSGYAAVRKEARTLGKKLIAEVVFGEQALRAGSGFRVLGGFRLADGGKLDDLALSAPTAACEKMSFDDPLKTPTGAVLSALRNARKDGSLDSLLLWDVIASLKDQALYGQRAMAENVAGLGLDKNEAGIIAAALIGGGVADGRDRQIADDLAAGRLREAHRSVAAASDEMRAMVDAALARVSALVSQADAEQKVGRTEQAARLLAEAAALAIDDDELPRRLAEIAPPSPSSPSAVLTDGKVVITWKPNAAQAPVGEIGYLIARGSGRVPGSPAEGVQISIATQEMHATDSDPPTGIELRYAVFAGRGGQQWSAPAATGPLVFAPDVADVRVKEAADAVAAVWRPPAGAVKILVTRTAGGKEKKIPADLTGFQDTGLTPGLEYRYQIRAVYRAKDGSEQLSAGVVTVAAPVQAPVPVDALEVQGSPPDVEVSWTRPEHGRVELWVGQLKPPAPGTELSQPQLSAFGRLVPAAQTELGKRIVARLTTPPGRQCVLAVTRSGQRAIAGASVSLSLAEPIRDLIAERLVDEAQLSWVWPAGAVDSIISWPGGERRCSRRKYDDDGGFSIPVGSDDVVVTVRAVHPDREAELIAAPVSFNVAGRRAKVSYRWLKAGVLKRGRRLLVLTTDRPCDLPELVVVHSTAKFPPDEPGDGVEIARLPSASVAPGIPLRVPVNLPKRATGFLACFTASGCDGGPLLFPPPPGEMKIK